MTRFDAETCQARPAGYLRNISRASIWNIKHLPTMRFAPVARTSSLRVRRSACLVHETS